MKPRFALWGLSLLPIFLAQDWAHGDQMYPSAAQKQSFTSCKVGVGCTHFEGYVVVQRRPEARVQTIAKPDAVLSANRLYLSTEDQTSP